MLENLNRKFRIIDREQPSLEGLAKLRADRALPSQVLDLYEEVGGVDIEGPLPQYFRFWPPQEVMEIDSAYGVSAAIPRAIPIGSDGGGTLIIVRDGVVFGVSYGALAEQSLRPLARSLAEFLANPDALWPPIGE